MNMKIRSKIKQIITKKKACFALSYSWSLNSLQVHETYDDYLQNLKQLRKIQGVTKRAQYYVDQFIKIRNQLYAIYLVSYGEIRKWKFIYGQNPLAKQFGVCMFDYVFCFVQKKQLAEQKINFRISILEKDNQYFLAEIMRKSKARLFRKQLKQIEQQSQLNINQQRQTKHYIDSNLQTQQRSFFLQN